MTLREENKRLREFIAASAECAAANDLLELQDRHDDLVERCTEMIDLLKVGGTFHFGQCGWCGEKWPSSPDNAETQRLGFDHDNKCAKNPLRIERDALRAQLAAVRAAIGGDV